METELEKCMIKATWETNREMRKTESDKVKEELSEIGEEVFEKEKDGNETLLDLQNMRATDLKNNKRVIIQKSLDDDAEIKRSYLKNLLK
jgi:seryl-tRNA synthetase